MRELLVAMVLVLVGCGGEVTPTPMAPEPYCEGGDVRCGPGYQAICLDMDGHAYGRSCGGADGMTVECFSAPPTAMPYCVPVSEGGMFLDGGR